MGLRRMVEIIPLSYLIFRYKKECIRDTFDNDVEDYRSCIEFYFRGKQLLWFLKEFILSVENKNGGICKDNF